MHLLSLLPRFYLPLVVMDSFFRAYLYDPRSLPSCVQASYCLHDKIIWSRLVDPSLSGANSLMKFERSDHPSREDMIHSSSIYAYR